MIKEIVENPREITGPDAQRWRSWYYDDDKQNDNIHYDENGCHHCNDDNGENDNDDDKYGDDDDAKENNDDKHADDYDVNDAKDSTWQASTLPFSSLTSSSPMD